MNFCFFRQLKKLLFQIELVCHIYYSVFFVCVFIENKMQVVVFNTKASLAGKDVTDEAAIKIFRLLFILTTIKEIIHFAAQICFLNFSVEMTNTSDEKRIQGLFSEKTHHVKTARR